MNYHFSWKKVGKRWLIYGHPRKESRVRDKSGRIAETVVTFMGESVFTTFDAIIANVGEGKLSGGV